MICRFAEQIGAFVDYFRRTPRFFIIFAAGNDNNHRYMKKIVLMMMALVGALSLQAEEYAYLTFETTDGAKASVAVSSLTLTINGNTLTAGSQTFTLSNLSKMYFSNTDETTGIEEITSETLDEATDIYDLQGHQVTKDQMKRGVYIVKTKTRTYKMIVK